MAFILDYKIKEIREKLKDYIKENDQFEIDLDDLHNEVFNLDYYIIGTYQAKQWLGDQVFEVINFIKEYEQDNFGEVTTDFSDPERVVNMYTYIIGEQVVSEYRDSLENKER
tara:strand:+ start:58 stop:393 length:336 start_codon:yes stop_codon:yes gene_type:complete